MNINKTGYLLNPLNYLLFAACFIVSCDSDPKPANGRSDQFEITAVKAPIQPGIIDEASGLAISAHFEGYLWTHQDSGWPASVFLLSKDGKTIKEFGIPGAVNHDWEDIAAAPGPENGVNYLFIGDIGNNNLPMTATNTIYRVPEILDMNGGFDEGKLSKIRYRYVDGPRDAEALIVDPVTKDIFIISKEAQSGIYRLPFPQSTTEVIVAERLGTVPGVGTATSGDIAVDGTEIVIRAYLAVYYWTRKEGETVAQTLTKNANRTLIVELEPQGEGICFDRKSEGFYTLSEKGNAERVSLNYYKRK
ncbi:MAG TPA: PE-PGRS family protein [Dyadobacter sp.]|jgi:hypothetical protein|nr:PE-PGRS family protein [Dyadobacter sp.]